MIENMHIVIYWTGVATWISFGFLFLIAMFCSGPFVGPDIYEPHGDTTGYDRTGKDYRP